MLIVKGHMHNLAQKVDTNLAPTPLKYDSLMKRLYLENYVKP